MVTYQIKFDALGDPTRREILDRLLAGPLPVGKLADGFSISRPAISQHLAILKNAHLVADHALGTRRFYAIDPQGFEDLRAYFDRFWNQALSAFKNRVEENLQ